MKFARDFSKIVTELGGQVILSVRAEMRVVSEEYWDHFVAFRYPSMEALKSMYRSDGFHEANANRINGLEATIAVLFKPTPLPE